MSWFLCGHKYVFNSVKKIPRSTKFFKRLVLVFIYFFLLKTLKPNLNQTKQSLCGSSFAKFFCLFFTYPVFPPDSSFTVSHRVTPFPNSHFFYLLTFISNYSRNIPADHPYLFPIARIILLKHLFSSLTHLLKSKHLKGLP